MGESEGRGEEFTNQVSFVGGEEGPAAELETMTCTDYVLTMY